MAFHNSLSFCLLFQTIRCTVNAPINVIIYDTKRHVTQSAIPCQMQPLPDTAGSVVRDGMWLCISQYTLRAGKVSLWWYWHRQCECQMKSGNFAFRLKCHYCCPQLSGHIIKCNGYFNGSSVEVNKISASCTHIISQEVSNHLTDNAS